MRMRKGVLGAVMAAAVAMAGCSGATRPSKYYALELPAMPAQASGNSHAVSLLVGRMTAPHLYRDDRLVYRSTGLELGTYEYHRWAEPPTDMLEAMIVRMLRTSGKYQTVQALHSNARGDYIVRGRLHDFEEVAGESSGIVARVAMEVELYELKSGKTVWTHFYAHDEPVAGKDVPDVVAALNKNVQAGLAQMTASLDQYFTQHPPK